MTKSLNGKTEKLKNRKLKDSIPMKTSKPSAAKLAEKKATKSKLKKSNIGVKKTKKSKTNVADLTEDSPCVVDPQVRPHADQDSQLSDDSEFSTANQTDRSSQRANRLLKNDRLKRTVFVGNLPLATKRNDLRRLFNRALMKDKEVVEAGCRVESVRIRGFVPPSGGTGKLARRRAAIQGETPAGVSSTLIAYVVLTSPVGLRAALTLNGHWLDPGHVREQTDQCTRDDQQPTEPQNRTLSGRHIRVDCATRSDPSKWASHCVFLGNLPFDVVEDEIRTALSVFGEISNVRLIRDRESGAVKGFGYAQFTDPVSVSLAIRASETVNVRSRPIRVQEWRCPDDPKAGKKRKITAGLGARRDSKRDANQMTSPTGPSSGIRSVKLKHRGRVKGITLPSNVRGSKREWILAKRLQKKRKREIRRQLQRGSKISPTSETGTKTKKQKSA